MRLLAAIWAGIRLMLTAQYVIIAILSFTIFGMLIAQLLLAAMGIRWGW